MAQSPKTASEKPEILDSIARARKEAGGDDAAFIRLLNEFYATKERGLRARNAGARAAGIDRRPRVQQLLSDPRYLENARKLARRTLGGTRVIGGTVVPKGQFLDCVAVGSDDDWGCTGTLIARDVVVTAGHCVDYATRVFFGNDVTKPQSGVVVGVRKSVRHPSYHKGGKQNDLMVLLLAERVKNIKPRGLASTSLIDKATDGRVVGFGNTDPWGSAGYGIKRQVDVPVASPACKGKLKGQPDSKAYGCDPNLEIVAGMPLLAKDSCTGDSGGPFYLAAPGGDWVLAGATSRATNQGPNNCGDGGIYVRLDKYRAWIAKIPGVTLP